MSRFVYCNKQYLFKKKVQINVLNKKQKWNTFENTKYILIHMKYKKNF